MKIGTLQIIKSKFLSRFVYIKSNILIVKFARMWTASTIQQLNSHSFHNRNWRLQLSSLWNKKLTLKKSTTSVTMHCIRLILRGKNLSRFAFGIIQNTSCFVFNIWNSSIESHFSFAERMKEMWIYFISISNLVCFLFLRWYIECGEIRISSDSWFIHTNPFIISFCSIRFLYGRENSFG